MSAVREFASVSISDNSNQIQINSNDSNFSVVPGSVIFIAGDRPRLVTSGDTTNRTLTLAIAYSGNDIVEKSATLIPLGQNSALLDAITSLTQAQNGLAEAYGEGPGTVGEISFSMIVDPPQTATQWPTWTQVQGDITEVLPEPATRWPAFSEVTGTIDKEQLPEAVRQDKKSLATSPPIRLIQSLNHILNDYPTIKKVDARPTESPNNKRLIRFDDVRTEVHIALTDRWFTIPTTISSRAFPIFYRGLILRFNNSAAYTGNIKMRVYPMGTGGSGLPNNPSLADHQWHEYETTVTDLYKIGEFNSQYFEGIIEYIELDTGWHQFDVNQSDVGSLNAKFDVAFGTFRSPFRTFYQKVDGYWYSEDMTPSVPNQIGPSWAQDAQNPRVFTVTDAEDGNDALRFFDDSFDDFEFELVIIAEYLSNTLALTVSNRDPNKMYYAGSGRFITDERIFFKRAGTRVTGAITVESIKMRIPHYG
ncbi:hypothetical protein KUL150_10320 [Alteromonas sp. KUL150]|uniref:hypothetical protein n=1 Tax=Alteromonas sp. KUL150 TaxID=2480805 RepID=UPI0012E61223|nr:hypothetical protein [Alteromonas sp. KUL150]GFD84973.1 hypothetical protein KUL150_10320 [Alteromonas sp. KUL150]